MWKFHIPSTDRYRTSEQATFYPKIFIVPTEIPMDTTSQIASTLTRPIQRIIKWNQTFQGRHGEALQKLEQFFGNNVENITPTPTTKNQNSSTSIAPNQICIAPHTYQRVTRANTPGIKTYINDNSFGTYTDTTFRGCHHTDFVG